MHSIVYKTTYMPQEDKITLAIMMVKSSKTLYEVLCVDFIKTEAAK